MNKKTEVYLLVCEGGSKSNATVNVYSTYEKAQDAFIREVGGDPNCDISHDDLNSEPDRDSRYRVAEAAYENSYGDGLVDGGYYIERKEVQ